MLTDNGAWITVVTLRESSVLFDTDACGCARERGVCIVIGESEPLTPHAVAMSPNHLFEHFLLSTILRMLARRILLAS